MATNTLTNINPEIIVQEVLPAFKAGLAPVGAFSTDYSAEAAQKGEKIQVPVITAKTANTGAFTTYEDGDTTIESTEVVLDTRARSFSHLSDDEWAKTSVNAYVAQAREDAYAVGRAVFEAVLGLFTAATFGNTSAEKLTVAPASYDSASLAQAITLLKKRDALGPFSAIHDLDYIGALMEDVTLTDASALGSDEMIREGAVSMLLGASIFESNAFPTAITSENMGVVIAVPSAAALAIRPIVPQEGANEAGTQFATATDPATGLTLGFRRFYNNSTGTRWQGFEVLFGTKAVQTEGAVRVVSA